MLKITHENKSGIFINSGIGRSAYICKTKNCAKDPKLKKKSSKSFKDKF